MCGIIASLSYSDNVSKDLISALERLEYRGYDSAGVAYLDDNSSLQRIRTVGKVQHLKEVLEKQHIKAHTGIGHTRWATHGKVTESNAHPHTADGVAIVHNGIIENYQELKKQLVNEGYIFESETDTEVIAKLIASHIKTGEQFFEAFKKSISELVGTFAIVAIYEKEPDILLGAKKGSPMAVGLSPDKQSGYIASDAVALSTLANELAYLEEGDIVVVRKGRQLSYEIFESNGQSIRRETVPNKVSLDDVSKKGYDSFMLKEIFEEATVARRTYEKFNYDIDISKFDNISIIACGTSYYAGAVAKYWIEDIAKIHVDVEIASEFRYRNPVFAKNSLYIFISQSGETIDTLCAMRLVKEAGIKTLALVNVDTSSIAREADFVLKTEAGVEIGVASTKAFVAQILSLLMLCYKNIDIKAVELSINAVLNGNYDFTRLANKIKNSRSLFYIGRGVSYPIALEGALKIKELSYISAEGYPAGEIKHGPIAIIDENVYTMALAPYDKYFDKTISN
ncbi:MAG: glutamine--fructose-6-phosphate transaminase (isomerizing), partial [Alphaproteobacteria bacterium]|nr:glutamine--fructose-6-phosphate transaminase (isomerizing) [Alphaproteobacteria bacterium]